MELLLALDAAVSQFGVRLAAVVDDQWHRPTPCSEWDVHFLVAHVIGGNRFAAAVLGGASAADAFTAVMSSPQLGDDAMQSWADTVAAQSAAFARPGALNAAVDHPLGSIAGRDLLAFRVFDITLHTWDLACAIGADQQLPDELVEAVTSIVELGPPGMGFGIEAVPAVEADVSAQQRLLAMCGRVSAPSGHA